MKVAALAPGRIRGLVAVVAVVALLAAACTRGSSDTRSVVIEPAAATAPVAEERAPAASATPVSAAELAATPAPANDAAQSLDVIRQAYQEITSQLFKEIAPGDLLGPAWRAVGEEARRQGARDVDVRPYAGRGSDDIDGFAREYAGFAAGPGKTLDLARVGQAAVRGMASAVGDSHTRFLSPEQADNQRRAAEGQETPYTGIGVRLEPGGVEIAEVYAGSPADRAGLRPGDRIIRVDGRDVNALAPNDISARVRGPEGTDVRLTVQRLGEQPREVTVSRARVTPPLLPVVESRMIEPDIGLIKIRSFPRRTAALDAARDFDEQLARLLAQGARGIVLDLRGNPGGDPFASVAVASNFVPRGPIFISVSREGQRTVYPASQRTTVFRGPLAVLVDRGSASGAEVVASALQEYGAGHLIGTRTCGCLSVGRMLSLDDSSGLVVTVEQALTGRKERSLEGVGLDPDELIRGNTAGGSDPQRDRAVAYLHERIP